jgi:site-specific DNA recombinase
MTKKHLKAALYARVSSEMQIENTSIKAQLTELTQYCKTHEIKIHDKYVDKGISGTVENRKGLQNLLKDSNKFDVVLVHKFDRFARKVELSAKIKRILRENNVKVISITEPIEDSPIGFFQEGLLSLLSEYYIKNLSSEVKKGKKQKAINGEWNGGRVNLGYNCIDKQLIINPDESKLVKWIFEMYIQGYGTRKIARMLNEKHIKTKMYGLMYQHYMLQRILKNPLYMGYIQYDNKLYKGLHEPIITEDVFNAVQQKMKPYKDRSLNNNKSRKNANYYRYYLVDLLYCDKCKKKMRATYEKRKTGQEKAYYICSTSARSDNCDMSKYFRTNEFEEQIENILKKFMQNEIRINCKILPHPANKNVILVERLNKINIELDRAKKAYLSEVFDLEEYKKIKINLENEKKEIQKELKNKQVKVKQSVIQDKIKTVYDDFIADTDILSKRNKLKSIVDKIYISYDKDKDSCYIRFDLLS